MPFSSFSSKFSYPLSTHYVVFDQTNMYIKLKLNNSVVKTIALGGVIDMRVNSGNIQTGTIVGLNGSFDRTIDFNEPNAGLLYDADAGKIIGTVDVGDNNITKHTYGITNNSCPLRVAKNIQTGIVTMTCPCDLSTCAGLNAHYIQVN